MTGRKRVSEENSESPFLVAIKKGDANKVETFISKGTSVNSIVVNDKRHYVSPLNYAIQHNQLEIVKLLVKEGALINSSTSDSIPLLKAALMDKLEIFKFLISKGGDVHFINGTIMRRLIENNKIEMLQCLTKFKANLNRTYDDGETPLIYAITKGNVEIVKWMLENGAKHSVPEALPEAIAKGSLEILRCLLDYCPNVNFKYRTGTTCLIKAIESSKMEIVEELVEHKANVNLISTNGTSPLMRTIELKRLKLAMFLLDKGADANVKDDKGDLPLTAASRLTDINLFKKLMEVTNDHNKVDDRMPLLFDCIRRRNLEDVKWIVESGITMNLLSESGYTPLTMSAEMDYYEMCLYFVEKGASVNEADENGRTALFIAATKTNFDLFEYLVSNGANLGNSDLNEVAKKSDNFAIYLETVRRKQQEEKQKMTDAEEFLFS